MGLINPHNSYSLYKSFLFHFGSSVKYLSADGNSALECAMEFYYLFIYSLIFLSLWGKNQSPASFLPFRAPDWWKQHLWNVPQWLNSALLCRSERGRAEPGPAWEEREVSENSNNHTFQDLGGIEADRRSEIQKRKDFKLYFLTVILGFRRVWVSL